MSPLTQFSSPAYLTDFTPENAKLWSTDYVSKHITRESENPQVSQFYNEVTSRWKETPTRANITRVAFPNSVWAQEGNNARRWRRADERHEQDEYCEWSVQRNETARLSGLCLQLKVQSTGTGWGSCSQKLSSEHNPGFDIRMRDLFHSNGTYCATNRWNNSTVPGCIMHLIQRNNTLGAQFHLAGQFTVLRIDCRGKPIRESDSLIICSRLGVPTRISDPHIGIEINNLAHGKTLITVADPIGLYLHDFNGSSFEAPDNADVNGFWKWTRGTSADPETGTDANWVRTVFEVPLEKDYVVGDIEDHRGNKIEWGSQLADRVQVRLTGQVIQAGLHEAGAHRCLNTQKSSVPTSGAGSVDAQPYVDDERYICDRAEGIC